MTVISTRPTIVVTSVGRNLKRGPRMWRHPARSSYAQTGPSRWRRERAAASRSELQRLGLLHLRQRLHLGELVGRDLAVDLDQRDGVAAGRFATNMESRDVDAGVAQCGGEL